MEQHIERVDEIPLLLHCIDRMGVEKIIDSIWTPHGNRRGLTYGQLAVLFVVYVVHGLNHRLYQMEQWLEEHQNVIRQVTGWSFSSKDATDDRLGSMTQVFGTEAFSQISFYRQSGRHHIEAYALPTNLARYDTTSFNAYHSNSSKACDGLLRFGHSKDHRPDLLQFKQGLMTLDPGGFPLFSETLQGSIADDTRYVPAWRETSITLGHKDFLYVADCKAAALNTRGTIAREGGRYLFPLPMTGEVPEKLRALVLQPPVKPHSIYRNKSEGDQTAPHAIGRGFSVQHPLSFQPEQGNTHHWEEQWFIVQSRTYAKTQAKACMSRIKKAEAELKRLKPKKNESAAQLRQRPSVSLTPAERNFSPITAPMPSTSSIL